MTQVGSPFVVTLHCPVPTCDCLDIEHTTGTSQFAMANGSLTVKLSCLVFMWIQIQSLCQDATCVELLFCVNNWLKAVFYN